MNLEKIIRKPITTLEYPDPVEARRYVDDEDGFYGYDYVFLETPPGMRCARLPTNGAARSASSAPTSI